MGVSTDAHLAFGFNFDEDLPDIFTDQSEDGDEGFDFDDWWAEKMGFPAWSDKFTDAESTEYFARKRDLMEECPVELVRHCSYDAEYFILAVRGTNRWASRGYPEIVDPASLVVKPEQIKAMEDFCLKYEIPYQKPEWLLFSMWG